MLGEDCRLIELPLAKSTRVERHRNQGVEFDACETRIGEAFALNLRKNARKPHFAVVFETVNGVADGAMAAGHSYGTDKRKLFAATIRADEISRYPVVGL